MTCRGHLIHPSPHYFLFSFPSPLPQPFRFPCGLLPFPPASQPTFTCPLFSSFPPSLTCHTPSGKTMSQLCDASHQAQLHSGAPEKICSEYLMCYCMCFPHYSLLLTTPTSSPFLTSFFPSTHQSSYLPIFSYMYYFIYFMYTSPWGTKTACIFLFSSTSIFTTAM